MATYITATKTATTVTINFNNLSTNPVVNMDDWSMAKERWRLATVIQKMPDNTVSFRIDDQTFQVCALVDLPVLAASNPKLMPVEEVGGTEPQNAAHLCELLLTLYE